jgi:hypothetical protein
MSAFSSNSGSYLETKPIESDGFSAYSRPIQIGFWELFGQFFGPSERCKKWVGITIRKSRIVVASNNENQRPKASKGTCCLLECIANLNILCICPVLFRCARILWRSPKGHLSCHFRGMLVTQVAIDLHRQGSTILVSEPTGDGWNVHAGLNTGSCKKMP